MKKFCIELYQRFSAHHVPDLAAQLSYYFLLAMFPFLIFTFTVLAYTPLSSEDVLRLIAQYVPLDSMELIERNVRSVLDVERGGLLSISIIVAFWSASNGTHAIIRALNKAYDVEESRSFIVARLVAIVLTGAMIIVIVIALLLPVFGRTISLFLLTMVGLSDSFIFFWEIFRWIISFFVIFIVFCFLYYFAPNRKVRLNQIWVGALFATVGWQATSYGFSFYLTNFTNYANTYGSLGGVIVLMLWFFIMGILLILGGEINSTREFLKRQMTT